MLFFEPEGDHRAVCMIHQVFANAAIKKMRKAFATMSGDPHKIGLHLFREIKDPLLYGIIVEHMKFIVAEIYAFQVLLEFGIAFI